MKAAFPERKLKLFSGAGWLVTFGDLLTLLLCLFITIISQSPLNRNYKPLTTQGNSSEAQRPPVSGAVKAAARPGGTDVAQVKSETSELRAGESLEMSFLASDFESENGALLGTAALERLKKEVSSRAYAIEEASLETCDSEARGSGWYLATARAVSLRSQVIDAGLAGESVSLRVTGAACSALKAAGQKGEGAVALLDLKMRG